MIIHIAIPRFALSGGNLVSLELAKYLEKEGLTVYCLSGCQSKRASEVVLIKPKRGIVNSLRNLLSFLFLSVQALFYKNYISTHHLTSVFNFIKRSQFALVQDLEVDFYPERFKRIGGILWNNYLCAHHLLFTNTTLAAKVESTVPSEIQGLSFVPFEMVAVEQNEKNIDAIAIIRDGKYKDPDKTLQVMLSLQRKKYNVCIINASRQTLSDKNIISNLNRNEFVQLLLKTKVFVCLSQWEGLGLPNLEAFVAGCHIVSTAIPSALAMQEYELEGIHILDERYQMDTAVNIIEEVITTNDFPAADINFRLNQLNVIQAQWLNYIKEQIIKGKKQ
ncbi:glycosyltransferase [Enterobacter bugandensis]|uniref:glycosyltransferase n=1 Tax=Enterobacter bugandensis TaxID=881260 RepID=UPI000A450D62|nr:glycosyltransferase [Enterobacter bugandensis]